MEKTSKSKRPSQTEDTLESIPTLAAEKVAQLQETLKKTEDAKVRFSLEMEMDALGIHCSKVFPIIIVEDEDGRVHPIPIKAKNTESPKRTETAATYLTNLTLLTTLPQEYPHARLFLTAIGEVRLVNPKRVAIICNKHRFVHERTKEAARNLVDSNELYRKLTTADAVVTAEDAKKVIDGLAKPLKDVIPGSQDAVSTLFDAILFVYKLGHKASYASRVFDLTPDPTGKVHSFTGKVMHREFTVSLRQLENGSRRSDTPKEAFWTNERQRVELEFQESQRRRSEEERQQAEGARLYSEKERLQAEEQRQRAEDDRQHAEEERQRAAKDLPSRRTVLRGSEEWSVTQDSRQTRR